jgi:hypothetical protein
LFPIGVRPTLLKQPRGLGLSDLQEVKRPENFVYKPKFSLDLLLPIGVRPTLLKQPRGLGLSDPQKIKSSRSIHNLVISSPPV